MSRLYLYIVTVSHDPNKISSPVPWQVDSKEIFFGPCKKPIREKLREQYLGPETECAEFSEPTYIVGVNGSNKERFRKVIWAGRLKKVMTFAHAYTELKDSKYQKMRNCESSPLHLKPMLEQGQLVGYEHISKMHERNDDWILDLVKQRRLKNVRRDGKRLLVKPGVTPWNAFPRDACILLENIFFVNKEANIKGLAFDDEGLQNLKQAQPDRKIDNYAIFGYRKDGTANGRTGSYLEISTPQADVLIDWIKQKKSQK